MKLTLGIVLVFAVAFILMVAILKTFAGDPTGYWQREAEAGRAPPKEWWNHLRSEQGTPCCDVADGVRVDDVDWDTQKDEKGVTHYRVYLKNEWHVVPDSAVVHDPNRFGPAVVWPLIYGYGGGAGYVYIRCFLPGAGT